MIILLDMDGVVTDAHEAFLKVLGRPDLIGRYPVGQWHIAKILGMSDEQFWRVIDQSGRGLWSKMRTLPWAEVLYHGLRKLGRVVFCTTPSYDPESLAGKLEWLQRFTGQRSFTDYTMTWSKDLLAGPDRVLVDDRPEICESFRAAGGLAVEFPAGWQGVSESEIWQRLPRVLAAVSQYAEVMA